MSLKVKNNISYLVILSVCICFAVMYILLGNPSYATNDDEVMNMIAAGAYGPDSQYLIYIKIVLGFVIKMLYVVFPHINCYWWFFVTLNFVAIYSLCLMIGEKEDLHIRIMVTVLMGFILGQSFFEHIQYTQNASLYAVTAYVMLYKAVMDNRKVCLLRLFFSVGFALISFLTRSVCFWMVTPFAIVMFFAMFWRCNEYESRVKKAKIIGIWFGCVILLVGVCILGEHYGYGTKEWKDYLEIKEIRHHFVDYDHMYEEDAQEIGYSENTLTMLTGFNYADVNVFSYENLSGLLKSYKENAPVPVGPTWIMMTCRTVLEYISGGTVFAVIWIILLYLSVKRRNRYDVFMMCGLSAGLLAGYWFLLALLKLEWRAEMGMWLAVVFFGMFFMMDTKPKSAEVNRNKYSKTVALASYVCIAFICVSMVLDMAYSHRMSAMAEDGLVSRIAFFREIKEGDYFYICPIDTDCCEHDVFAIDDDYRDLMENVLYMGGWLSSSPLSLHYAADRGITNPITALWEIENVRLAADDGEAEMVLAFIKENYDGVEIEMEYEGEVAGYKIWSFHRTNVS